MASGVLTGTPSILINRSIDQWHRCLELRRFTETLRTHSWSPDPHPGSLAALVGLINGSLRISAVDLTNRIVGLIGVLGHICRRHARSLDSIAKLHGHVVDGLLPGPWKAVAEGGLDGGNIYRCEE